MNELSFYKPVPSKQDTIAAQEKLKAIVRYLARCEAEKDYYHQKQQNNQRKDH